MQNKRQFLLFSMLFFVQSVFCQTVDSAYQVGTWFDFRNAAVSFTFDDGTPKQFTAAVPLFNEFDLHLTLFTVTRNSGMGLPNWEILQQAANDGHEIASHTLTHTSFADLDSTTEDAELADSQLDIDSHITGQKCITMAYPYCVTGEQEVCAKYYLGARICSGQIEAKTPRNFMAISSIICGTEGSVKTADNFVSKASSAIRSHGWCVYLLHGVDGDGGWSPVTSDVLRETLQILSATPQDYWVDSFGNVLRYMMQRNAVSVSELSADEDVITVQVTDTLSNDIFDLPVSIRRELPAAWGAAIATQNEQALPAKIVEADEKLYIQFDVVPDGADIVLTKTAGALIETGQTDLPEEFSLMQNYPNPFNPLTFIHYSLPIAQYVSLSVYNLAGELVESLVEQHQAPGQYKVCFSAGNLASGLYFYTLKTESFHKSNRMLLIK